MSNHRLQPDKPVTVSMRGAPSTLVWTATDYSGAAESSEVALTLRCTPSSGDALNGRLEAQFGNKRSVVERFSCGSGDDTARFLQTSDGQLNVSFLSGTRITQAQRYALFSDKPIEAGYVWNGSGPQPSWVEPGPPPSQRPTSCHDRLIGGTWTYIEDPKNPPPGMGWVIFLASQVYNKDDFEFWLDGKLHHRARYSVEERGGKCRLTDLEKSDIGPLTLELKFMADDRVRLGTPSDHFEMSRIWAAPARHPNRPKQLDPNGFDEDVWGGLLGSEVGTATNSQRAGLPSPTQMWALLKHSAQRLDVTPPMTVAEHIGKHAKTKQTPPISFEKAGKDSWLVTVAMPNDLTYVATIIESKSEWKLAPGSIELLKE